MSDIKRTKEDYLEAIYSISSKNGFARTTDISDYLKIKPPSVTEMLQKLSQEGFLIYKRYRGVTLTENGKKIGKSVKGRHDALRELLQILQIPDDIADKDACKMEHDLDPTTIIQIKKFLTFVKNCPKSMPRWLEHFKEYSKTGKFPLECMECK